MKLLRMLVWIDSYMNNIDKVIESEPSAITLGIFLLGCLSSCILVVGIISLKTDMIMFAGIPYVLLGLGLRTYLKRKYDVDILSKI